MFTGIIQKTGLIETVHNYGSAIKLSIRSELSTVDLAIGDSIAVNGVCLTLESQPSSLLQFHVLRESLEKSNLRQARPGTEVNLESALRLGDKLGGHLVSGHIDGTSPVYRQEVRNGDLVLEIKRPAAELFPLVPKGSVAVNGVSLTVAELQRDSFSVCVIPYSWKNTNLRLLQPGAEVNLEADLIGKYLYSLAAPYGVKTTIDLETLHKAGFF